MTRMIWFTWSLFLQKRHCLRILIDLSSYALQFLEVLTDELGVFGPTSLGFLVGPLTCPWATFGPTGRTEGKIWGLPSRSTLWYRNLSMIETERGRTVTWGSVSNDRGQLFPCRLSHHLSREISKVISVLDFKLTTVHPFNTHSLYKYHNHFPHFSLRKHKLIFSLPNQLHSGFKQNRCRRFWISKSSHSNLAFSAQK